MGNQFSKFNVSGIGLSCSPYTDCPVILLWVNIRWLSFPTSLFSPSKCGGIFSNNPWQFLSFLFIRSFPCSALDHLHMLAQEQVAADAVCPGCTACWVRLYSVFINLSLMFVEMVITVAAPSSVVVCLLICSRGTTQLAPSCGLREVWPSSWTPTPPWLARAGSPCKWGSATAAGCFHPRNRTDLRAFEAQSLLPTVGKFP